MSTKFKNGEKKKKEAGICDINTQIRWNGNELIMYSKGQQLSSTQGPDAMVGGLHLSLLPVHECNNNNTSNRTFNICFIYVKGLQPTVHKPVNYMVHCLHTRYNFFK